MERTIRSARLAVLRRRFKGPFATLTVFWPFSANLTRLEGVPAELVLNYTLQGPVQIAVVTQRKIKIGMYRDDIVAAADIAWSTAWPGRRFAVHPPIEVSREWTTMTNRPQSELIINATPLIGPTLERDGCRAVAVDAGAVVVACAGPPEALARLTLTVR
jgi:hypothetical protein